MSKLERLLDAKSSSKVSAKGKGAAKGRRLKPLVEEQYENRPRRGRPSGKRSDPDFVGFTTYIRKQTHRSVKHVLLDEPEERELSELVEELLAAWLKSQPKRRFRQ